MPGFLLEMGRMPGYLSASVTMRSMDRGGGGSANGITGQRSSNRVQSWVV